MFRRNRGMIAVSLAGATVWLLAASPLVAQERFNVSGQDVAIYNLAGEVTVRPGSGSDVVVELTRGGGDSDRLSVETGPIDGRQTLRVIYPATRVVASFLRGGHNSKIRVRPDGTFWDSHDRRDRGDQVSISSRGSGLEAWAHMVISVPAGKRIDVHLAVGSIEASNLNGEIELNTGSAPVTATGITGSLDVDVGSGQVEITEVNGDLSVDTGSGRVTARNVTGDRVNIDTGSGGVRGEDITATTVNIDTGSGGIDVTGLAAERILMDTGSGGVDLVLARVPSLIEIDTGSGGVTIRAPEGLSARVDFETGSGSMSTDFPLTLRRHGRDHLSGTIGDGAGRIVVETGSGSIRLIRL